MNWQPRGLNVPVLCPDCWAAVHYIGAGCFACATHGEVVPISILSILPEIKAALNARAEGKA